MNPTARLVLALSTSGLVLMATASGALAFWPSAFLWAVPAIVAVRCLPLPAGLALAFAVGAAGRTLAALASAHAPGADGTVDVAVAALAPLLASAVALPALAANRLVSAWLPRAGFFAWPCALVVTVRALAAISPAAAATLAPVPHVDAVAYVAGDLGGGAAIFATAAFAQTVAWLGSTHNWRVPDPLTPAVREAGVRLWSVVTLIGVAALGLGAVVRVRVAGPPAPPPPGPPGDDAAALTLAVACAVALLALLAAAASARARARAP